MKASTVVFAAAFCVQFGLAKPTARNMVVHESIQKLPSGFTASGQPSGDTVLTLRVGLVQSNFAGLEDQLYAVSTPGNGEYGQHLSQDQVCAYLPICANEGNICLQRLQINDYIKPSTETVNAVTQWLSENGITTTTAITPAGDWLEFNVPVSKANELLSTEFQIVSTLPLQSGWLRPPPSVLPSVPHRSRKQVCRFGLQRRSLSTGPHEFY